MITATQRSHLQRAAGHHPLAVLQESDVGLNVLWFHTDGSLQGWIWQSISFYMYANPNLVLKFFVVMTLPTLMPMAITMLSIDFPASCNATMGPRLWCFPLGCKEMIL